MAPIWCTSSLKITLLRKVKCGINGKMTKIKDGRGKGNLKLSLSKFKPTSFYHHCTFCTYFANPIFQNMKSLSRMIYRFLCKNLLLCQYKMCCWESNGKGSKSFDPPPRRLSLRTTTNPPPSPFITFDQSLNEATLRSSASECSLLFCFKQSCKMSQIWQTHICVKIGR